MILKAFHRRRVERGSEWEAAATGTARGSFEPTKRGL